MLDADHLAFAADFDDVDVGMDVALDALTGEAIVAPRFVHAIHRLRDADRRLPQRIGRRAVQDDRVMQLAALGGIGEECDGVVHARTCGVRRRTTSSVFSKTSSGFPLASTTA